ncbi:lytic transglycosylase domain-containing protein [Rhodanobacter denitrificans]|nr:lytic transglycosylase domain-containing protein [Rhodanobacter sp. FW510-R10]
MTRRKIAPMALSLLCFVLMPGVRANGASIRTISMGDPAPASLQRVVPAEPAAATDPAVIRVRTLAKARPNATQRPFPEDDPRVRACVAKASAAFDIQPLPLYLILEVEGGEVGKNSKPNRNGTYDIGKAQINSSHLDKLAARGISEDVLRDNLCVNILVQGWLYKDGLQRSKSQVKAIALYHSPNPALQRIYLERIEEAIARRVSRLAATP